MLRDKKSEDERNKRGGEWDNHNNMRHKEWTETNKMWIQSKRTLRFYCKASSLYLNLIANSP